MAVFSPLSIRLLVFHNKHASYTVTEFDMKCHVRIKVCYKQIIKGKLLAHAQCLLYMHLKNYENDAYLVSTVTIKDG